MQNHDFLPHLLGGIAIDMVDLAEYGNLPYKNFIKKVISMSNEISSSTKVLTVNYFNSIIKHNKPIIINMSNNEKQELITIKNNGKLTNGELLYHFSRKLGDYDETEEKYGNHAHFDGFIRNHEGIYYVDC